jgi:hypothetical protein
MIHDVSDFHVSLHDFPRYRPFMMDSMELSPSSENSNCSGNQEIPSISWKSEDYPLPCFIKKSTTGPCPEPDESTIHPAILFLVYLP